MNVGLKSRTYLSTDFAQSLLKDILGDRSRLIGIICTATVATDDATCILWYKIGATHLPVLFMRQTTIGNSRIYWLGGPVDSQVIPTDPVAAPPAEGIYGGIPTMPSNEWVDADGSKVELEISIVNVNFGSVTFLYTTDSAALGEYV